MTWMKKNYNHKKSRISFFKNSNLYLLMKHGFLTMIHSPLQVLVIFTLSFLSTILLTMTMSTTQRLKEGFDNYVNSSAPFDYTYSYQVGFAARQNGSIHYLPYLDLTPEYSNTPSNLSSQSSSYNLIFSNQYSLASSSAVGKTNPYVNLFAGSPNNLNSTLFENDFDNRYFSTSDITSHWNKLNTFQFDTVSGKATFTKRNFKFSFAIQSSEKSLQTEFEDRVASYLSTFKLHGTLLGDYYAYLSTHGLLNVAVGKNAFQQLPEQVRTYIDYIYDDVRNWLNNQINNYFNYYIGNAINEYNKSASAVPGTTKVQATSAINNFLKASAPDGSTASFMVTAENSIQSDPTAQSQMKELVHEYLFGQGDKEEEVTNKRFIGTYKSPYSNKGDYLIINNDKLAQSGYHYYGLRGMVNPTREENGSYSFANNFDGLGIVSPFYRYFNQTDSTSQEFSYMMHQKMAALITGFNDYARNEMFVFDRLNKINYRVVFIQNDDPTGVFNTKVHIMEGYAPKNSAEIAISPQFARANKLKIGQTVLVGTALFFISGIGTDAYSFIPTTDNVNVIPNVNKSAIIYAPIGARNFMTDSKDYSDLDITNQFLTYQNQNATSAEKAQAILRYQSFLMNKPQSAQQAIEYQQNRSGSSFTGSNNAFDITRFSASHYRFNWSMLPTSYRYFSIVCYIATIILAIIVLFACYITVRVNVKRDSSQIAIFKALGLSKLAISWIYFSYALLICLTTIPLGWMIGILLQWPVSEVFLTFFSLPYNMINIDWRPLLIVWFTLGTFIILVSFWAAYRILNKSVAEIMHPGLQWKSNQLFEGIKTRYFANAKFKTRFRFSILSFSFQKIVLMSSVFLVASVLITGTLLLPSYIVNVTNTFYKNLKYKNSFTYAEPTNNMPMAKEGLSLWNGPKSLESQYTAGEGYDPLGGDNQQAGYARPSDYYGSNHGNSAYPLFVMDPKQIKNNSKFPYDWSLSNAALNGPTFINFFNRAIASSLYGGTGAAFSIGSLQGALDFLYHYIDLVNNKPLRRSTLTNINSSLQTGLGSLLAQVLGVRTPTPKPGQNWSDVIVEEISSLLPPYIASYVNSSVTRQTQFTYGWGYNLLQPQSEVMSSTIVGMDNKQALETVGLSQSQPIVQYDSKLNSDLFVSPETASAVSHVVETYQNGDGIKNLKDIKGSDGTLLYDHNSNTINVPILANQQAGARIGYTDKPGILNNSNLLLNQYYMAYKQSDGKIQRIPRQFWTYDDRDYVYALYKAGGDTVTTPAMQDYLNGYGRTTSGRYIDNNDFDPKTFDWSTLINYPNYFQMNPFDMNNSKFTNNPIYQHDSFVQSNATNLSTDFNFVDNPYAFVDNYTNQKQALVPYMRPQYSYNNMILYLPADKINVDLYTDPLNNHTGRRVVKLINAAQVPASVKKGYDNVTSWLQIHPLSLMYDSRATTTSGTSPAGVDLFTQIYLNWYYAATRDTLGNQEDLPAQIIQLKRNTASDQLANQTAGSLHIKLNPVGSVDTYDTAQIFADQKLVNAIADNPTSTYLNYNIKNMLAKPAGGSTAVIPHLISRTGSQQQIYLFNKNQGNGFSPGDIPRWYNSKYSFVAAEPYDLTTYYSDSETYKTGNYLPAVRIYSHGSVITDNNLLSINIALLNRLMAVCLSIASVLIVFVVICGTLLILIISQAFISQYERFMTLMKLEGYTKWEVIRYTINVFTPFVVFAWGLASFLTWLIFFSISRYIFYILHYAVPFTLPWWVFLISFVVIFAMYTIVFYLASRRLRTSSAMMYRQIITE